MYTFTYLYINICVFVRIYTYWDVPPPSSSHQQHILTFWLGGFTITFHCEWERSIPIYTNMYIYALFSRCTYYIYSTYCRCIGYLYIYIHRMYIIYTDLYLQSISFQFPSWPNKFMPVTSRPSSVFFLGKPMENPKLIFTNHAEISCWWITDKL